MVQMGKTPGIQERWKKAGEPYCDHSHRDKEYALGADTGDYLCLDCGISWSRNQPVPEPRGTKPE